MSDATRSPNAERVGVAAVRDGSGGRLPSRGRSLLRHALRPQQAGEDPGARRFPGPGTDRNEVVQNALLISGALPAAVRTRCPVWIDCGQIGTW